MFNTIEDLIYAVQNNELILPAIQRNYVWDKKQIYRLFDSLMQEFPLGEFLVWNVSVEQVNKKDIVFYKFLSTCKKFEMPANEILPRIEKNKKVLAVLDGQQRIQSLYLGLLGTYSDSTRKSNMSLYLNLIERPEAFADDDNLVYEFAFLTDREMEEQNTNSKEYRWFPVGSILNCHSVSDIISTLEDFTFENSIDRKKAKETLKKLMYAIICDKNSRNKKILSYYEIEKERPYEEVLEMFIRKNNGGTHLNKSDLLFSNVVLEWPDAKKKITTFLQKINTHQSTKCFAFDVNFIMQTSIYLFSDEMKMDVGKFRKIASEIKVNWNKIDDAISQTVALLLKKGFANKNITAYNAVIPIVYYIYNGGKLDKQCKEEIKKYLIIAQLKKLFGASSNTALSRTRDALKNQKKFSLQLFSNTVFPGDKDFKVDKDTVTKWLNYKKDDKYTFMILTLLYPNVNVEFGQTVNQDHLHSAELLKRAGHGKERDLLANLQLIGEKINKEKSKMSLEDWVKLGNTFAYRPKGISLDIKKYDTFIEKRGELIVKELLEILK